MLPQKNKKRNNLVILLFISQAIFLGVLLLYVMVDDQEKQKKEAFLRPEITVAGISLASLTKEEASEKLYQYIKRIERTPVQVVFNEREYVLDRKRMQIAYNVSETIRQARIVSEQRSGIMGMWRAWQGYTPSPNLPLTVNFNRDNTESQMRQLAQSINRTPVSARVVVEGKSLTIFPEAEGYTFDEEKTLDKLKSGLQFPSDGLRIQPVIKKTAPKMTKKAFSDINSLLSSQTIKINKKVPYRLENAKKAASFINGTLVMPQQIFSFNKKAAPLTEANGYTTVQARGEKEKMSDGVAGGAIHVASALYLASAQSGLPIIERYNHPYPVDYVKPGRDALVDGNMYDFSFVNKYPFPVYLYAEVKEERVTVSIFGDNKKFTPVSLEFKEESVSRDTSLRPDKNLPPRFAKLERIGENGIRMKVMAMWKEPGGTMKESLFADDYYKPVSNLILVGYRKEADEEKKDKEEKKEKTKEAMEELKKVLFPEEDEESTSAGEDMQDEEIPASPELPEEGEE